MALHIFIEHPTFKLKDKTRIKKWLTDILSHYQKRLGEINYIITDNDRILDINRTYLNHDYYTDIITFGYDETDIISGDVYISVDTVSDNAVEYGVTLQNELMRVMSHGLLHMIGFDDQTENQKKEMRILESECIERYGQISVATKGTIE